MRTDREIAAEALRRAEVLREQKQKRQSWVYVGLATAACLALVAGLSFALSAVLPDAGVAGGGPNMYSGTLLLGGGIGGYVLMGVIGFVLGTAVTLLARRMRDGKR